ncbi:hypothetical protein B0H19DRAFT_1170667 [Mycena capillaripes]|nr:hypothetical protein B0H19DRAFT_1170667 [Mycena capillaripes]
MRRPVLSAAVFRILYRPFQSTHATLLNAEHKPPQVIAAKQVCLRSIYFYWETNLHLVSSRSDVTSRVSGRCSCRAAWYVPKSLSLLPLVPLLLTASLDQHCN